MTTCTCCGQEIAYTRYIRHDGGRSQSKRPRQQNDCAVRALAIALDSPYDEVYDALASHGRESSHGTYNAHWKRVLQPSAAPTPLGRNSTGLAYDIASVGQFCNHYRQGRFVVFIARHAFAMVDGICYDLSEPKWLEPVESAWRIHTVRPKLVLDYHFE